MSATLLFLHAHPDDESILTGATMAGATRLGYRVLVAYATHGDAGETNADLGQETLGDRRTLEALAACEELGVARVEFLGFDDSGMADTETTKNPAAFCNSLPLEVAQRLATVFGGEPIDAIVGYDRRGTYGHPDHIQIHHVAHAAAPVLGAAWILEATYHREYMAALPNNEYGEINDQFASPEHELTHFFEEEAALLDKLAAISHHRSQVPDDFDLDKPDIAGFARMFGTEWYIATPAMSAATWDPLASLLRPKSEWTGRSPLSDFSFSRARL